MSVELIAVANQEDQALLATIADEIWHEYWPSRIGLPQTDYMVNSFQSLEAIERDMRDNAYEYWFICSDDPDGNRTHRSGKRILGYTGGHVEPETNRFFISKLYLFEDQRGKGYASKAIAFYDELCRDRGLRAMYLTVNKYNDLAINVYKAKGFISIDATETDIGDGFIMDDYIMERPCSA